MLLLIKVMRCTFLSCVVPKSEPSVSPTTGAEYFIFRLEATRIIVVTSCRNIKNIYVLLLSYLYSNSVADYNSYTLDLSYIS